MHIKARKFKLVGYKAQGWKHLKLASFTAWIKFAKYRGSRNNEKTNG